MSNTYTWEPVNRGSDIVDPYTKWLLETEPNSLDLERFSKNQGDPWVLIFAREDTQVAKDGLSRYNNNVFSWKPKVDPDWRREGKNYAFWLGPLAHKQLRSDLLEDIPIKEILVPNGSEVGPVFVDSDAQAAENADFKLLERYIQFAPLDTDMIAKKDPICPPDIDIEELGINPDKAVIVGVIDDGINIAHERFIDPSGNPRIDYAWIQEGIAELASSVLFGREITGAEIKTAVEDHDTEEATLRALGLVNPAKMEATTLSKSFSHGTFVLDALAGYPSDPKHYPKDTSGEHHPPDENDGIHPKDRRIIAVQLHRRVTLESSGALYSLFAMLGLEYIVERALLVAKKIREERGEKSPKVPLVINFSYGLAGGPHNGDHLFERFVDQMVEKLDHDENLGPLIVSMPTGNRHLLKGHARAVADKDDDICLDLNWITQPQDKSPNYLEIWVPIPTESAVSDTEAPSHLVALNLTPPFGGRDYLLEHKFDLRKPGNEQGQELRDAAGNIVARVSLDTLDATNADESIRDKCESAQYPKARILVALLPTYPVVDGAAHIPPGLWSVSVTSNVKKNQYIEAWIQRDDSPPYFRRPGRQSYLEDQSWTHRQRRKDELTEYVLPMDKNAGLSRYGAISGLATGERMLRVSGVRHYDDDLPAIYSGAPHEGMRMAEVAAPSDRSRVLRGLVGTGGRSGSTQIMNGTSVAAPFVGRNFADFLSKNNHTDAESAICAFLQHMEKQPTSPLPRPDSSRRPVENEFKKYVELIRRRGGKPIRIGESDIGGGSCGEPPPPKAPSLRR